MIAIAKAVRPLKAKLQRKQTLRLIITQQGLDLTMYAKILIVTQYRGVCRISQGGGPTLKFLGFWIGMSRAAKLRAFARGVWGHVPPRNFF